MAAVDSGAVRAFGESPLRWFIAVPPLAVTLVMCLLATGTRAGVQMFADEAPQNPSEAAIQRDLPALVTFRQTEDLRQRHLLRPDYMKFDVKAATPLEASILSQSGTVVRFVAQAAPPLTSAERDAAICLALDVHADETAIHALLGDAQRPACVQNASLAELQRGR